jgi:hypothetical protein
MDAKVSRMIADRVTIATTVQSALDIHATEMAPALEALLFPGGAPKDLTVAGFITALRTLLDRRTKALIDADLAHTAELADDDGYRSTRDENIAELRVYITSLRNTIVGNYGAEVAGAYGLNTPLPDDAQVLVNMAASIEKLLRTRSLAEPPKRKSLTVDPIAAADDLRALGEAVAASLNDVEREKREAQMTLNVKSEAMSAWSHGYEGVADAAAALLFLAGRPDLADRVRPTAKRRQGMPEAEDTQQQGQPAGGGAQQSPPKQEAAPVAAGLYPPLADDASG